MLIIAICLAAVGAVSGSFVSALVWRLHQQSKKAITDANLSVINGRSMCPNCHHQLGIADLVPVLSWLLRRGHCRYCGKPYGVSYLVNELVGAAVFSGSYLLWPASLAANSAKLWLAVWLISSVGLLTLAVYDLRWQLLPTKIILPTALVVVVGRAVYLAAYSPSIGSDLLRWLGAVVVASGIFWLLFQVSKGKWIGYGDVRLGFITGSLLGSPQKALLMIFLASILGSLAALPSLASGKRQLNSQIPYGPFLTTATAICVLFGDSLLNWYHRFLV